MVRWLRVDDADHVEHAGLRPVWPLMVLHVLSEAPDRASRIIAGLFGSLAYWMAVIILLPTLPIAWCCTVVGRLQWKSRIARAKREE